MTLEPIERYSIEQGNDGIVVKMRQGRRALGVALLSLAVLAVSWWFGPYGPRPTGPWASADRFYWIWSAFFAVALLLGLLGASRWEDWTITDKHIIATTSLGLWRQTRRVETGRSLGIRIEVITGSDDQPVFPYRVRVLDAERKDSGLVIELQQSRSVDQLIEALRTVLPLDFEDTRRNT